MRNPSKWAGKTKEVKVDLIQKMLLDKTRMLTINLNLLHNVPNTTFYIFGRRKSVECCVSVGCLTC